MSKHRKLTIKQYASNYAYIVKRIWKHSKKLIIIYLFKAVADGVNPVIQAFLIGGLINELIQAASGNADKTRAITYLVASAGLQLVYFLASSAQSYIMVTNRELVQMELGQALLESRIDSQLVLVETPEVKDKFEKADRGATAAISYLYYASGFISAIIGIVSVIGALLATVPWVLLVLVPLPIINTRMSVKNLLGNRDYWDKVRPHRMRVNFIYYLFESEKGVLEARMFGLGAKLISLWRSESIKVVHVTRKREQDSITKDVAIQFVESLVGVAVDIWLVTRVFAGVLTVGAFEQTRRLVSAYILSLNRLSASVYDIISYGYQVDDYRMFLHDSTEYQTTRSGETKLRSSPNVIAVDNLSFRYPTKDADVLKNISLEIHKGQSIAIVGENGAGKTSLIKTLLGFYDPSSGTIAYDGIPHAELDFSSLLEHAASLNQEFYHFDFLTIGQSISLKLSGKYDSVKVKKVLKTVGMLNTVMDMPKGLDTNYGYVEDDGFKVSGGQAQKIAIARILYRNSSILVMDEPTSAIDAKSEQEIMDHIFDLYKDRTLIVISHRLSTVSRADKIIFLKDGRVTEQGTHKELFKPGTDYYDLFHKQAMRIS